MNVTLSECIAPSFFDLHKQLKSDTVSEVWMRGGRGSTKSSFTSIEMILGIMKDKEANAVVFRRYENEIRDSVFGQMLWAINKLEVEHLFKSFVSPFKIVYEPTGQVILFKGADNPKKLKSIKLPTGYLKYAWFEEVDQFSGIEELRNILQSIFRGTTNSQIAFYSYNPPKSARSWANAETKIEKTGRVVHYSDYRSVPQPWLGKTFLDGAEHLKAINPDAYDHEYLGRETGTGLEVFTNVVLRPITDKEISYFDHRSQGLDFGYASDPLCFLEGHFDNKKKILYLFFEIAGVGIKNSQFASRLSEMQRLEVTMADSSEPKSIDELREEYKVNVVPVEKAPGSVDHGIKYLQDLEQIVIDPLRCPLAAKEFINYSLQTDKYGDAISRYPDRDNHCFVGETLVSTPTGPRRIDQIQPGDLVLTRKGSRKVSKVFKNGAHPVVTTRLWNGKSLTLTDTHNIITSRGDVMFKDLQPHDIVYYEVPGWKFIETENRKLPYLLARNTADIQRAREEMIECTLSAPSKPEQTNTSMLRSTKACMAQFQTGVTFTIKMATLLTTRLIILGALRAQSTYLSMRKSIMQHMEKRCKGISTASGPLQNSGTLLMQGSSGTVSTRKPSLGIGRWLRLFVSIVERATKLTRCPQRGEQGFAQTAARQPQGLLRGWITKSGCALCAAGRLLQTSIGKKQPAPFLVAEVYDLEVENTHEYFANGLLVHNSVDSARYLLNLQIIQAKIERRMGKFKTRRIPILNRW